MLFFGGKPDEGCHDVIDTLLVGKALVLAKISEQDLHGVVVFL